jgi:hypothetical protein
MWRMEGCLCRSRDEYLVIGVQEHGILFRPDSSFWIPGLGLP